MPGTAGYHGVLNPRREAAGGVGGEDKIAMAFARAGTRHRSSRRYAAFVGFSARYQGLRCAPPLAIRFRPLRGSLLTTSAAVWRTIRGVTTAAERHDVNSRGWSAAQPPVMMRRCDFSRVSGGTSSPGLSCRVPTPHCCFTAFTGKDPLIEYINSRAGRHAHACGTML